MGFALKGKSYELAGEKLTASGKEFEKEIFASIKLVVDDGVESFLGNVSSLLYADEPTHSLMLGLCYHLKKSKEPLNEKPLFVRIVQGEETISCAMQIAPLNLIVSNAQKNEIEFLVKYLHEQNIFFPGVVGPKDEVDVFNAEWMKLGYKSQLGMAQKIYKIEQVRLPNIKGELRLANPDEVDLITQWLVDFGDESLPPSERKTFFERKPQAERAIKNQLAYIWVCDGKAVSMAHIGRPTDNGISVSAVFTPKNLRRSGFASAIVAHLSQKMLNEGKKFCVLYTDISNSTSNKIYQNVGYEEVSESKHYLFSK